MPAMFLIFNGSREPFIHPDHPVTRSEAVSLIASGENMTDLHSVVSFELGKESRDATAEIVAEVLERLADRGEPLSRGMWELVELQAGHQVARCFEMQT